MSWSYAYDPHVWPAVVTAISTVILGLYSWRRRTVPGGKPFAIVCLFAALWAVGSILETSAAGFSTKVFWIKFQAIWQLPTVTALLCFVLEYVGFGRWLSRRNLFLLAIIPSLTLLLIVTNDYHHLIWTEFRMNGYVTQSYGIVNWTSIAYAYLLNLVNIIIMLWLVIRSPYRRWPAAFMLFGLITGLVFYLLVNIYTDFLRPDERILFTVGSLSLVYAFVFFRFRVFDPVPAARKEAIDQMHDGMLVLDLQGQIIDLNRAAAKALGQSAKKLLRTPIAQVLPNIPSPNKQTGMVQSEISLGNSDATQYYNLTLTPLIDRSGHLLGQLLLLHEVTEQKRAQRQILEQERVVATLKERERLARELHDGIGQVLGYVGIQAQTASKWVKDGDTEKARSLLGRLVEVAKDAHADVRESILSLRSGSAPEWSFGSALKQYLDNFQANYGIRTELSLSNGTGVDTLSPEAEVQLLRVIQEALTNARKHSGAHAVRVIIEQDKGQAHITITDDGGGFDVGQADTANGSHFGLVLMRERMEQIGGSLKIDSRAGAGTVVELYAPFRDQGGKG